MVHFVGAGPGAIDLITVRGKGYIESADIIIYAGSLINKELLSFAKNGCRLFDSAYMTLEEVIKIISENMECNIVRLHTGDPAFFGAIREQMDEMDRLGIDYDVCPGVSSMSGAASSLKLEYTLPGISQGVIVARVEGRTPIPKGQSLKELAGHNMTMVIFLSAGLAKKVKSELLEGGLNPDTAVSVVYKATWEEERIIYTTINKLPDDMERFQIDKTALIIVGSVLNSSENDYERSKLYDPGFSTMYRDVK